MHIQLLIPGLLWPGARTSAPSEGLSLPALEMLLGLGRAYVGDGRSADSALLERFGLPPETAIGPLRRRGEALPEVPSEGHWLCADPVGLHFAREHLLLIEAAQLDIERHEADQLVAGLNQAFADIGRFEIGSPERWYLRVDAPTAAHFTPVTEAASRPVAHYMPSGEGARDWHRLINEVQVWLHGHPVNQTREAANRKTINSIWPWGAGLPANAVASPAPQVITDSPLARGLGRIAGATLGGYDAAAIEQLNGDTLICCDALQRPALYMDLDAWRDALAGLERDCFAPLLRGLRAGRIKQLDLTATGDRASLELSVIRGRMWPFWKRALPLQQLIDRQP